MAPCMMPAPPICLASTMHTRFPKSYPRMAAAKPPGPEPITQMSNLTSSMAVPSFDSTSIPFKEGDFHSLSQPCGALHQGIGQAGLGESLGAQPASRTGSAGRERTLVAGMAEGKRFHGAQFGRPAHRFGLGLEHQGGMDREGETGRAHVW